MKAKLSKASDWEWEEMRDLASLDDLCAMLAEFHSSFIINLADAGAEHQIEIRVYDDYVE